VQATQSATSLYVTYRCIDVAINSYRLRRVTN